MRKMTTGKRLMHLKCHDQGFLFCYYFSVKQEKNQLYLLNPIKTVR
jgi:hypothetical protein